MAYRPLSEQAFCARWPWHPFERRKNRSMTNANRVDSRTTRVGGHAPHGASVEYAYRTGNDGIGHTYVHHVNQRGCSALLVKREGAVA